MNHDNLSDSEKKMKEKFNSFTVNVNTENLWSEIKNEIPSKRRKRRPILFFLLIGALLLATMGTGYLLFSNKENIVNEVSSIGASTDRNKVKKTNNHYNDGISKLNRKHTSRIVEENTNTDSLKNKIFKKAPLYQKNLKVFKIFNDSQVQKQLNVVKNEKEPIPKSLNIESEKGIINSNISMKWSNIFLNKIFKKFSEIVSQSKNLESNSESTKLNYSPSVEEVQKLQFLVVNEEGKSLPESAIDIRRKRSEINSWKLYYSFDGSINQTLLQKPLPAVQISDIKESGLTGSINSAGIGMVSPNGWRFNTSLIYSRAVVRINYTSHEINQVLVSSDDNIFIDENGEVRSTQGNLGRTYIDKVNITKHRYHHYFGISIGSSKEVLCINNFSVSPTVNFSSFLFSEHSGYFINTYGKVEKINNNNSDFSSNLFVLNTGLTFSLKVENLSFGVQPYVGKSVSNYSIEKDSYNSRKNSQYGVKFGINYQLD